MASKELNRALRQAQKARLDEFYTQLPDIERELRHYKQHFKGKVVYCNCDDPRVSNFFHYFSYNFEKLGLKKLITTCYKSQSADLFSQNDSEQAIYLEYDGDKNGNSVPDPDEIGIQPLRVTATSAARRASNCSSRRTSSSPTRLSRCSASTSRS